MDKTKIAVDIFNRYAIEYQNKFMDVSLYHKLLDQLCQQIPNEGAQVLEVACGPGNLTQYLLKQRPDLSIYGIDLAPKMIDLARQNNPTATFDILDGKKISDLTRNFEAIVCGFFFPYLSKEEVIAWMRDAAGKLKADGLLYFSTMEDDYSTSGLRKGSSGEYMFMHFHEAAYLTRAMKENNLEIIDVQRVEAPASDGSTSVDLQVLAIKKS